LSAFNGRRREFLKAAGLGAAAAALPGWRVARAAAKKPDIIFIMVDDLGKEWVSSCGGEGMKTPVLDELAAGGIRFTNAYSMPQCTPTRATLLTGQYPWRHGWINHWDVPRWGAGCHFDWKHNPSFARVMKSAGYATCAVGKWQINDFRVQPDAMARHGFDEWCMWTGYETGVAASAKRYWDPYVNTKDGSRTREGRFGADVFTDFLIDFMKRNRDRPMMLYFPMALTHGPFTTTPLDRDASGNVEKHKAMVRYVEHCVKRLTDALDELGLRKNTIVIFTTDNGTGGKMSAGMNGRKVRGGKGKDSENGICEPFIVNCPGLVPAGVVSDALTDFTDMLPTFAELGGAKLPEEHVIDGKSIAKVILGKVKDSPREWIMAMGHGAAKLVGGRVMPQKEFTTRVLRDKRWKLWVIDRKSAKLFDLAADPGETTDLIDSADPAARAALAKLEAVWKTFPEKDPGPRYDPTPPQAWDKKPGGGKKRRGRKKR
jgi:arylsulfatase A-like enzyme